MKRLVGPAAVRQYSPYAAEKKWLLWVAFEAKVSVKSKKQE